MFSLTPREQTLVVFVLGATLLGAAIKHSREARRERLAEATASTSPAKTRRAPRSADQAKTSPPPDITLAEEPADR